MISIAIVDSGPLVASANTADPQHQPSVISLAERFKTDIILTLDHRHFEAIRPRHCEAFRLLP